MKDCIFCKIIAGEIPCKKVYEDEFCLAFHDINPRSPIHILVVPKIHLEAAHHIGDYPDKNTANHLFSAVGNIVKEQNLIEKGYRLVINNGKGAGQEVFHLHIHIMSGFGGK